jgi:hypothetical protein
MSKSPRSIAAAVTLFFVAPLVAEYLLGDFAITSLSPLILMAPMYGGGALLIRELARRTGRGWPAILLLGCAYCLIEEGFSTQTLFNPNSFGLHLLAPAWIPSLGIGAWWTLFMLNVHPFWSIGVSIALAEGLFPSRARTQWLGNVGAGMAAVLFAFGMAANAAYMIRHNHFVASTAQFAVTGVICILFVVAAFLIPASAPSSRPNDIAVPPPWLCGLATFLLGFAVFLAPAIPAILIAMRGGPKARMNFFDASNAKLGWAAVAWILAVDLIFLLLLWMFSRRSTWTLLHTFSIGAAGALAYGVQAFMHGPVVPAPKGIVFMSHVLLLVLAIAIIAIAAQRTRSTLRAGTLLPVP